MSDDFDKLQSEDDFDKLESVGGAEGGGGSDTAPSPTVPPPSGPMGSAWDAVKSFANTAALGAGPQIEGLVAAAIAGHQKHDSPADMDRAMSEAYRGVRDMGAAEHNASESTALGKLATIPGALATPIPVKSTRGLSVAQKALRGAATGGAVGAIHGGVTSGADLTKPDKLAEYKKLLVDTLIGGAGGAVGGGIIGGGLGAAERPLRSAAETQALKAAGLRGGISNQVQRTLGLSSEEEARQLGRQFLDEGLIPFAGSKESVVKQAEKLRGMSGNAIGSTLAQADASGVPFDYARLGAAADKAAAGSNAVEAMGSSKAQTLAKALEEQGKLTPGSFAGANQAKSSAWEAANFADDAPVAAKLYRRTAGAARGSIEEQIRETLGDDAADALIAANKRYGVAADALKLAKNAGTRDVANSSLGLREQLMLAAGLGGGVGAGVGHGVEGIGAGLAGALVNNWGRKHGNAAASRIADFLAERAAQNTGGGVGGMGGSEAADALAPYLGLLKDEQK